MHWTTQIEGGPKRVNHAAVAIDDNIYTFGGYCTGDGLKKTSMDVHVLNTTTLRWVKHPVSDAPYSETEEIVPNKRYGHTAVAYNGKIYLWGGRNEKKASSRLFCFDLSVQCWAPVITQGATPLARDGHTACVWNNLMYVFGGFEDDSEAFAKSVYILNLDTFHWCYVSTRGPIPMARDFHTAVCLKDKMYVFGGRGTSSTDHSYSPFCEVYSDEVCCLDLRTHEWQPRVVQGLKPTSRRSHSAFVYKGKMFIFGGYNSATEQHFNDVCQYDPVDNVWRQVMPLGEPPCKRRRQACIAVDDRIFLFGGTSPVANTPENAQSTSCDKLTERSDMHILDLNITLKMASMIAVKRFKLDVSVLPCSLRLQQQYMFESNKNTEARPIST